MDPKQLMSDLECPICTYLLKPPTHMCQAGHTICDNCYKRLPGRPRSCPECREPLQGRNFAIERMVEKVPRVCENQEAGCVEELIPQQLLRHQQECQWRKVPCLFPSCTQLQPLQTYNSHVQEHHAQHVLDISPTGHVCFNITPQEDQHHSVFFLRHRQSRSILPYYVNLCLDLTTNQLHACVCSWQEEASYDVTITTRDHPSLKVSCSLPTVLLSHGDDVAAWTTHDHCFFTKPKSIRVRRCETVVVSVRLKLGEESPPVDEVDKKCKETTLSPADEEQILSDIGKLHSEGSRKSVGLIKMILEEHERTCVWRMVECVVDECKAVVMRKDLEEHVLQTHGGDMCFSMDYRVTTVRMLWGLATHCTGQTGCEMKNMGLTQASSIDYFHTEKPCEVSSCTAQVTDKRYYQHIFYQHKDIAKLSLSASTFKWKCSNDTTCMSLYVLGRLMKEHNLYCDIMFGKCRVDWCSVFVLPTESNEHMQKYHKKLILDSTGWTQSVPVIIPDLDRYGYVTRIYNLQPDGRFLNYRCIRVSFSESYLNLLVEGSSLENIKFSVEFKSCQGKIVKQDGVVGNRIAVDLPLSPDKFQSVTITFTT